MFGFYVIWSFACKCYVLLRCEKLPVSSIRTYNSAFGYQSGYESGHKFRHEFGDACQPNCAMIEKIVIYQDLHHNSLAFKKSIKNSVSLFYCLIFSEVTAYVFHILCKNILQFWKIWSERTVHTVWSMRTQNSPLKTPCCLLSSWLTISMLFFLYLNLSFKFVVKKV